MRFSPYIETQTSASVLNSDSLSFFYIRELGADCGQGGRILAYGYGTHKWLDCLGSDE
jgi:hypothetical protein